MVSRTLIAILASALYTSSAATAIPNNNYKAEKYNASFDDRTALPAEPLLSQVGAYDGLYYNTFVVTQPGIAGINLAGVQPSSPPNFASTGVFSQLGQTPSINSSYAGSKVSFFTLQQFYLACAGNIGSQSAASVPTACTVELTGYYNGAKTGTQNVTYVPNNNIVAPMQLFFADPLVFAAVQQVTLNLLVSNVGVADTALLVDNLGYTTYNKTS